MNGSQISQVSHQKGWLHPVLSEWNQSFFISRHACLPKKLAFEEFCHCASARCFPLYSDAEQERESGMKERWLIRILYLSVSGMEERRPALFHWQCIGEAGFSGKGSLCHVAKPSLLWDPPNVPFRLQNGKKESQACTGRSKYLHFKQIIACSLHLSL